MRIARTGRRPRRGTVLPMLALCLVGLFGFVALAVDLGMVAVSRTECQNGADVAALVGCRTLNNKPTSVNSNLAPAVAAAKAVTTGNVHMAANFTLAQVQKIEVGQYLYDATTQRFAVAAWTDVTNSQTATPPSGSWTAIRVTLNVTQPTYFMKVFGVTSMPTGAVATAVYRPRDTAFALDMTGSMAFSSMFNYNGRSLNPDNLVPSFGHYVSTQSNLIATANQANGSGEAHSRNNYTITTPGGPPIVRGFYFDPANLSNPATPVTTVTVSNLRQAFHRWNPPASGADPATYTPPTYNFGGYDAFDTTNTKGPTPAPDSFGTMTDGVVTYVGDRWRRADGSINKTNTSWGTGSTATKAATTAIELLGYNVSGGNVRGGTGTTTITAEANFRDPVWEENGYDLDIVAYRAAKGNGNPFNPGYAAALVPPADRYVGYSMGPGYWGKTFYIWPPDPRFDPSANLTSPNPSRPAFDTAGRPMCDWRRRFFVRVTGATLDRTRTTTNGVTFSAWSGNTMTTETGGPMDPQADNLAWTAGVDGVNEALFRTGSGMTLAAGTVGGQTLTRTNTTTNTTTGQVTVTTDTVTNQTVETYRVNYAAVLRWLKTGPQTLPPNLRAGRVLYYSSIPDDVDTDTGSAQQRLDKAFWKNYIDFVLGTGNYSGSNAYLYGYSDSWSASARSITTADLNPWRGPANTWSNSRPYMRYNDSPGRPRLHFWFGPLSMMDFLGASSNWLPGTCTEAQCWQLKAGMNSVLDDIRNNHPNDYAGLVYFAGNHHNNIRRPMGQNFESLKNALFYPRTLLDAIDAGDTTTEIRPYTASGASISNIAADIIPNAAGSTDPNTGLAYAFNLLSPSANLPVQYGTVRGRRGAAKVILFETDGVPNTWRGISSGTQTMNPTLRGYDTFYPASGWSSGNQGNGHPTSMSEAVKVVNQIVKPMAATNGIGLDSGLSLPNAPARVYAIAFGDLFDTDLAPAATFRSTALQFLADVAAAGGTGVAGATTLPDHQIITGPYQQRIDRLRDCMERIFQSGVSVVLIE
jgi:hypothetical protein